METTLDRSKVLNTSEQLAKVFGNVKFATLEGTKLWATDGDRYLVEARVLTSSAGNDYIQVKVGEDTWQFAYANKLFDDLSNGDFDIDSEYIAEIELASPIAGVTDEQLQAAYGPDSRNPQPNAIKNYKEGIEKGLQRVYIVEMQDA
jgi:hypothetical protein